MTSSRVKILALLSILVMLIPVTVAPLTAAYEPGDEAAVFGHTFDEEYWTNSSILVETEHGNASFTASYVHVDDFQAFLLAFNMINTTDGKTIILPYQLFGMHFMTPENHEVFIGAIFAFLLVHNETYGNNDLPDVGNEPAWYVVPVSNNNPWPEYTPSVEPIPAQKLGENHYRFGMRYRNMPARIVDSKSPGGFLLSLVFPILTVMISEIVIQYDITIDESGGVHAETLYTIGQVIKARLLGVDIDPREIISENMEISAVHYLAVFTSRYEVTGAQTGHTIEPPTATTPLDDNVSIRVGRDNERAFDIGLGRNYQLINESTNPWQTISDNETAINVLLAARGTDFALVMWQAPLSAFLFAHMAYGLSENVRARYSNVAELIANSTAEFHGSRWWYGVTFPEWNGYRVQQDPVYVAYTNLAAGGETSSTGGVNSRIVVIGGIALVVIIAIVLIRRRR